jgi:hypothetical protein
MQVKEPLGKNRDGNNAAGQNWPHQQTALLDVINHGDCPFSSFSATGQAVSGRGRYGAWPAIQSDLPIRVPETNFPLASN